MVHFHTTRKTLEQLTGNELSVRITDADQLVGGDVLTTARIENISTNDKDNLPVHAHNLEIIDTDERVYAEAIIYTLDANPDVALLDWIEITNPSNRNQGVGRALTEETINYLEDTINPTKTYAKVENSRMQTLLIDTGFRQIETTTNDTWYLRD